MGAIAEMFRSGGVWMYLILTIALVSNPSGGLSLIAAALAKHKHKTMLYVIGVLCALMALTGLLVGALGYYVGTSEIEMALEKATPENRALLRERGQEIAMYPVTFAAYCSAIPLFGAAVALVRASTLKPDSE